MPIVEVPIPNLLGGVSQQPAAGRLPGQVEACDNALLHVVNGLSKRKGTRHIAKLIDGLESVRLVHLINRDPSERYVVLMGERRLRVFSAADGTEFPVRVNGTSTAAGRGETTAGTPLNYLDPRVSGGELDQDEDFVIGAGDWLTDAANSVTTYLSGRGPFNFGRRQSLTAVTADTVAEVGNGAAASVSDIHQTFGLIGARQILSVFVKKSSSAISDVELTFHVPGAPDTVAGARFDIDTAGVVTVGALISATVDPAEQVQPEVEEIGHGWYRCSVRVRGVPGFPAVGELAVGGTREAWIRFHTTGVTPANKRALLFGARCYDDVTAGDPVPAYVHPESTLFRALTVADSTFLLNTEKTTALTSAVTADQPFRVFVWVKQGGIPDVQYTVTVDFTTASVAGSATFTFSTSTAASAVEDFRTDTDIAEALRAAIDAHADLVATRVGSVVQIRHTASTIGNLVRGVTVSDSRGDTSMVAVSLAGVGDSTLTISRFTDLPLIFEDGFIVQVQGDPENKIDDYWVKFVGHGTGFTHGVWRESLRPGVPFTLPGIAFQFDTATLPQLLTRRVDDAAGTITGVPSAVYFDVSPTDWDDRLVGDDDSNPAPSFVGDKVRDVFLYRGRLGFLAEENVILSEAGEVFNFWRTTVLELVDGDPIDVNAGVRDVVLFRNGVPTADSLLLFSDRHQFQLLGEPTLTPASAQLAPVRAFENLTQARPADTGRGVVFARATDAFSCLAELSLQQDDVTFRFEDVTLPAPRYIAGRAEQLAHSSLAGLTVARSEDPEILYLHQSFQDQEEQRLQSALHRWVFDPDTQVRGLGFIEAELRLVVERAEGWFLETVLTDSEVTESGRPITHLDRRVTEDQVVAVYDGGADKTVITLPYEIADGATMQVVDAVSGLLVPVTAQGVDSVTVSGDLSSSALYVGESYTLIVTLSEAVLQDVGPRGGTVPRMNRPISVNRLFLYVSETAFLEVHVSPDLRDETVEDFSAAGLGTGLLLEGELTLYTGDADFSIIGRSTELTVSIQNPTPFPSLIESARWECVYRPRAAQA